MGAPVAWLPPPLALTLLVGCTAMVMACAAALWLGARLTGARYTHAALVGAMLGPVFAVGASGPVRLALGRPWGGLLAGLVGALLLVGLGPAAALLASRRERSRPPSPALVWTGAALLLAGLGRTLHGDAHWVAPAAIPIGLALSGVGLLGLAPQRGAGSGRLLLTVVVAAAIVPFWPWLVPWLLLDENMPEVGPWPPNLLFVFLEVDPGPQNDVLDGVQLPTLELVAAGGVSYHELAPEPEVASLLRLPDGSSLGPQLQAAGYATAAVLIAPDPSVAAEVGAEEINDRLGGRRLLEESAAWMAGAPLLLAPASPLLSLLGQDEALRSPEQVAADAAGWLLHWRTMRAPAPFFLLVDLRGPGARPAAVDAGLQILLDRVDELELGPFTVLVVAVEGRARGGSGPALRAVIAPPFSWSQATRRDVAQPIWGRALGLALLRIALSDGATAVNLPGLAELLAPPGSLPPPAPAAPRPGGEGQGF